MNQSEEMARLRAALEEITDVARILRGRMRPEDQASSPALLGRFYDAFHVARAALAIQPAPTKGKVSAVFYVRDGQVVAESPDVTWRVGSRVPLNVYEGDRPVCQCHNPDDAARIVAAINTAELKIPSPAKNENAPHRGEGRRTNDTIAGEVDLSIPLDSAPSPAMQEAPAPTEPVNDVLVAGQHYYVKLFPQLANKWYHAYYQPVEARPDRPWGIGGLGTFSLEEIRERVRIPTADELQAIPLRPAVLEAADALADAIENLDGEPGEELRFSEHRGKHVEDECPYCHLVACLGSYRTAKAQAGKTEVGS